MSTDEPKKDLRNEPLTMTLTAWEWCLIVHLLGESGDTLNPLEKILYAPVTTKFVAEAEARFRELFGAELWDKRSHEMRGDVKNVVNI
jgi:hypothetical protein